MKVLINESKGEDTDYVLCKETLEWHEHVE